MNKGAEPGGLALYNALRCGNDVKILEILESSPLISEVLGETAEPIDILTVIKLPLRRFTLSSILSKFAITSIDALIWALEHDNHPLFEALVNQQSPRSFENWCATIAKISERHDIKEYLKYFLEEDNHDVFKYNSRLDALLIQTTPLSDAEFSEIKQLLEQGYRPISQLTLKKDYWFCFDSETCQINQYLKATNNGNLELVKLLFQYDIKPNREDFLDMLTSSIQQRALLNESKLIPFLITNLLYDELTSFKNRIKNLFHIIYSLILDAKTQANAQGKPLMLLIGEHHYSERSTLLETIIITLANHCLNLTSVMTENPPVSYSELPRQLLLKTRKKGVDRLYDMADSSSNKSITVLCKKLNIKLARIDFLQITYLLSSFIRGHHPFERSEETISYNAMAQLRNRNFDMAKKAMAHLDKGDAVFITGAAHLYGLIEDTNLDSSFYIKALNLFYHSNEDIKFAPELFDGPELNDMNALADYATSSDKIYQTKDLLNGFEPFLPPLMMLDIVSEVCQQEFSKIKQMPSASSSSSSCIDDIAPPLQFSPVELRRSMRIAALTSKRSQPVSRSRGADEIPKRVCRR